MAAKQLIMAIAAMSLGLAAAECPNACNGHGSCGAFDMCTCHANWQGADCNLATCDFGEAHVTTPQGDKNMDGDRNDNSFKPLSQLGTMTVNTNKLYFANDLVTGEIEVNDGVKICDQTFYITAVDSQKQYTTDHVLALSSSTTDDKDGVVTVKSTAVVADATGNTIFTIDHESLEPNFFEVGDTFDASNGVGDSGDHTTALSSGTFTVSTVVSATQITATHSAGNNVGAKAATLVTTQMDMTITSNSGNNGAGSCTNYQVYKFLKTVARPNGDWERWPGDFAGSNTVAAEDEGHFYMECSNRGLCDRKTGICECFDGYTGRACARQACPNDCSGHGECMSNDELRRWNPTKLTATCETVAGSKRVICDQNVQTDLTVDIAEGDYIQIKPYPPMRVSGVVRNHFTFDNAFPETLPYGTEIYAVYDYRLWDKTHNQACKCDPRWSGNDCSLRKCPLGDDPLTITTTDDQSEGNYFDGTSSGTTTSDYDQQPERQTLTIVSDSQIPIGHFSLTFTDYYGDTFTTKPIPTEVQLSCTGRTYLDAATQTPTTTVTFDCADGLPAHELSEYDFVRIGADYLKVEAAAHATAANAAGWATRAIKWADQVSISATNAVTDISEFRSSKTHIRSFETVTAAATGGDGAVTRLPHLEGTRIYRQDVSPEIRRALQAIPNNRVEGCSVEAIERTGIQPWPVVNLGNVGDVGVVTNNANVFTYTLSDLTVKPTAAQASTLTNKAVADMYWKPGDIMRIGDELRRVEKVDSGAAAPGDGKLYMSSGLHAAGNHGGSHASTNAKLKVYKQNMFEYRIKFETGCSQDSHCTANGVDSTDSDQDAWCSAGGVCRCSDTSPTGYWGYGCTKAGRANHGAPYKRSNSGNLVSLKCDKSKMYSGMVIGTPAHVARTDPLKIVFDKTLVTKDANGGGMFAVGDEVYIDGQVRTVVEYATNWVRVNEPFYTYEMSDAENIIPTHSWTYLLDRDAGTGIRCGATDMPHLKQSQHSCQHYAASATSATLASTEGSLAHGPRLLDDNSGNPTFAAYLNAFTGQCEYTESQAWRVNSGNAAIGANSGTDQDRLLGFHKADLTQTNQELSTNTMRLLDPHEIHIGDRVRIHAKKDAATGGFFQTRTVDALVRTEGGQGEGKHGLIQYIHVDAPIDGSDADVGTVANGLQIFVDQRGTTEEAECSNRGLCDQSTGTCECFKGYTDDDCSRQDALSSGGSA